jgi:hypothetical protein
MVPLMPRVRYGPCRGVPTEWHGLRGYACEGGNRASWHDGGYSAERSACSLCLLQNDLEMRPAHCNKGEEQTDAARCTPTYRWKRRHEPRPLSTRNNCDGMRNADMKDYITLGDRTQGRQTGLAPLQWAVLSTAVDNLREKRGRPEVSGGRECPLEASDPQFGRYVLHFSSLRVGHGPIITSCAQLCG